MHLQMARPRVRRTGQEIDRPRLPGIADIHELDAASPFGRVSTPEDVASAVAWLVSSANPYANGQKININGGG